LKQVADHKNYAKNSVTASYFDLEVLHVYFEVKTRGTIEILKC